MLKLIISTLTVGICRSVCWRVFGTYHGALTIDLRTLFWKLCRLIAVFMHRPQGPGPRAANFQGRHIKKKIEIEIRYAGKKRLSTREKFKGDLYWRTIDTIDTIETHYNVLSFVSFLYCFCLHITEYEQIRGGTKVSWAQGHKIPKYGRKG